MASVIVHSASVGAGYPELNPTRIADEIAQPGKRVELMELAKESGTLSSLKKGIQMAREMVYEVSQLRRRPVGPTNSGLAYQLIDAERDRL